MQQAVVAAGPEQPGGDRRFLEREDRVVDLDAGVVLGHAALSRVVLLRLVVPRQVRADDVPGLPAVGGAVDELRRHVDDVRVVRRHADRRVPLEAVLHVGGALPGFLVGVDADALADAAVAIGALDRAAVVAGVDDVVVARIDGDVAAFAAGYAERVAVAGARHRDVAVVLLRGVDKVRPARVDLDAVQLGGGLIVLRRPGPSAVTRDVGAAVVAVDQDLVVGRADPEVVVVAVRRAERRPRLAAVHRLVGAGVYRVRGVDVLRVGVDVHVVEGALQQVARAVHLRPALAAVLRGEDAAVVPFRLHERVDALRVRL